MLLFFFLQNAAISSLQRRSLPRSVKSRDLEMPFIWCERFYDSQNLSWMRTCSTVSPILMLTSLPMACSIPLIMSASSRACTGTSIVSCDKFVPARIWSIWFIIASTSDPSARDQALAFGHRVGVCGCFSCAVLHRCWKSGWATCWRDSLKVVTRNRLPRMLPSSVSNRTLIWNCVPVWWVLFLPCVRRLGFTSEGLLKYSHWSLCSVCRCTIF